MSLSAITVVTKPGGAFQPDWLRTSLLLVLLAAAAIAAYANTWNNDLVLDDRFFTSSRLVTGSDDIPRFFTEDLWATLDVRSGHYRPVLLMSLWSDARLYGDWTPGYRLTNMLLHAIVTLAVFGFVRQILQMSGVEPAISSRSAWLAAFIFAVHPVHTEAVNSIFNRSAMLVAASGVLGLWWLLRHVAIRPVRAWAGFGVAYVFAMFAKESGVVLPGVAVVLLLVLIPRPWSGRLRKCLPVLWLLIPLAFYFLLRTQALDTTGSAAASNEIKNTAMTGLPDTTWIPDLGALPAALSVWGQSLKALVWPHPLMLYPLSPPGWFPWLAFVVQVALGSLAIVLALRKRYGLLLGLAFFYITILPSSRLIGAVGESPHLAERYLYLPSVGLSIALAFVLCALQHRFDRWKAIIPVLIISVAFMGLGWARNSEWVNEITLYESEYRNGSRKAATLRLLTAAHLPARNYARITEICEDNPQQQESDGRYSNHCAIAFAETGHIEQAEQAFLLASRERRVRADAHNNLAMLYLRQGRRSDAATQFGLAIESESDPAMRAFRNGYMLAILHRRNRAKLQEARSHFEQALRLRPRMGEALVWKRRLERELAPR